MYSFIGTIISVIGVVAITYVLLDHANQVGTLASGTVTNYDTLVSGFAQGPNKG